MTDQLTEEFDAWKRNPTPEGSAGLLRTANPILDRAVTTYAGRSNPILKARAKSLALKAFRSFDPKRGAKLRTHLMVQLQPLRRSALQTGRVIQEPERIIYARRTLEDAKSTFMDAHAREPSDEELADVTGLSARRIRVVRAASRPTVATGQLGAEYEVPAEAPSAEDTWLEYVYHELDPRDRQILDWRLGRHGRDRLANREIARRLKISPAAVSQRMARIAARLQEGETLKP